MHRSFTLPENGRIANEKFKKLTGRTAESVESIGILMTALPDRPAHRKTTACHSALDILIHRISSPFHRPYPHTIK
jgi:hypothetical protein